jgi:hypothetical protein
MSDDDAPIDLLQQLALTWPHGVDGAVRRIVTYYLSDHPEVALDDRAALATIVLALTSTQDKVKKLVDAGEKIELSLRKYMAEVPWAGSLGDGGLPRPTEIDAKDRLVTWLTTLRECRSGPV